MLHDGTTWDCAWYDDPEGDSTRQNLVGGPNGRRVHNALDSGFYPLTQATRLPFELRPWTVAWSTDCNR